MAGKSIPMGKMRDKDHPYVTISDGMWTWRILKAYVADPNRPFARVFASVDSPFADDSRGDTYWADIRGEVIQMEDDIPVEALQSHLRASAARFKNVDPTDPYNLRSPDGGHNER